MIDKSRRLSTMELVDVLNMRSQAESRRATAAAAEAGDPPLLNSELPPLAAAPPDVPEDPAALGEA